MATLKQGPTQSQSRTRNCFQIKVVKQPPHVILELNATLIFEKKVIQVVPSVIMPDIRTCKHALARSTVLLCSNE